MLICSQELSSKGRFSVNANIGCAPFTVNINEIETFGTDNIDYFYFDGATSTAATSFTYLDTGTYLIIQQINSNIPSDKLDSLEIQVVPALRPEIEITSCNNLEVSIRSLDTYYDSIRVYFNDSDSSTLQINERTNYTFDEESMQRIITKGFFDLANESCETYFEETVPLPVINTPAISNAGIKQSCQERFTLYLSVLDFQPQVNYRAYLTQSSEELVFDGFLDSTTLVVGNIPFNPGDFCVSIEAYDPCNNSSNRSTDFCQTPNALSLSPFESLFSSYNESDIFIEVDNVTSGSFLVQRRVEGGEFRNRNEVLGSFNDPIGVNTRKYFYQVLYFDSCGSVLYAAETHPPFIEARKLAKNEFRISFEPALNALIGETTESYTIGNTTEVFNQEEFEIRLSSTDGVPRQSISAQSTYGTGQVIHSNSITLPYELVVYAPSAFTPNGDGLNDTLEFFGLPGENASLKIYSIWGQLLYSSNEAEKGWDGTYSGTLAPEGTYLYEITFESEEGEVLRQKGTFALIN